MTRVTRCQTATRVAGNVTSGLMACPPESLLESLRGRDWREIAYKGSREPPWNQPRAHTNAHECQPAAGCGDNQGL